MSVPELDIGQFEVFATGLDHPEGLAFDRAGFLWAGGEAGQIYRIDSHGRVEVVTKLDGFCAGLAFSPQDELFLCHTPLGIVKVSSNGAHRVFADSVGSHRIVCANYPVFDRRGNLYVTDSGNWKKHDGYLLRFSPEGKGEILCGPFGYANGLALSSDEKYLFMVESDSDRIVRFALRSDGSLDLPEVYAEQVGRLPDGLAFDAEGNLYVACYASDEIYRVDSSGKKTLLAYDRHGILLGGPTNMAFTRNDHGAIFVANLSRYTITTARVGHLGQPLANQRT